MRESMKNAIGDTVQGLLDSGLKTSFTEKELKEFGINIPEVDMNAKDIQDLKEKTEKTNHKYLVPGFG